MEIIKGSLRFTENFHLHGWLAQIPVNGIKIVINTTEVQYRDFIKRTDVVDKGLSAELYCGFKINLNPFIEIGELNKVKIYSNDDNTLLLNGELNLKTFIDLNRFFLHIPKTAGTSFKKELFSFFGEEKIFPNANDLKISKGDYPSPDNIPSLLKNRKEALILSGHYGLEIFRNSPQNRSIFTFFREPISRAISNLKHHQRNTLSVKGRSLMEIAWNKDEVNSEVNNLQVAMLSGGKGRDLNAAIENLKSLSFVGLTEEYAKSIELCNKMMGWELKGDQFTNKGNSEQDQQITDELLEFLTEHNQLDIQLYEAAVERFEKDCEKFLS